jgi:hypothetical protein
MPEAMPEGLPTYMEPEALPEALPAYMETEGLPTYMEPEAMPEGLPEAMPEGLPEAMPEALPEALPTYMEPEALPQTVPSFDALLNPPSETAAVVEVPPFAGDIPDLNVQPVTGEFFAPLTTAERVEEFAVPGLEPAPTPAPVDRTMIPDMPPPVYDVPDLPPPTMPAYGAEAYATDAYGTAVQEYSADQFAQPYGWEDAGASALAAASGETTQGLYSPEAFMPTAPSLPDGSEAEMTSAVFSELSSLSVERPRVVRTKAGLQRRTKEEGETIPMPIEEIEVKAISRDPEAIRSSFSSFHSATNRARAAGDIGPDVRGANPNEVTP